MVVRSMPASRSQKLSVPSTSNKGRPAEKPNENMRSDGGSRYTRNAASQPRQPGFVCALLELNEPVSNQPYLISISLKHEGLVLQTLQLPIEDPHTGQHTDQHRQREAIAKPWRPQTQ